MGCTSSKDGSGPNKKGAKSLRNVSFKTTKVYDFD